MSANRSAVLRQLLPGLVLALWLAPQLLLSAHGHWSVNNTGTDCEICAQLATSTPAIGSVVSTPLAFDTPGTVPTSDHAAIVHRSRDVACRGPPASRVTT